MKPSIPKGTRDFSPIEMVRRNYILDTIRTVYQRFGFQQIETPTMENLSTLEGKYGDEGDKLLFRVLNSGHPITSFPIPKEVIQDFVDRKMKLFSSEVFPASELIRPLELQKHIAEKGLRYDLTVPFARYVVMHQNEITFPFKRYQIQPVWRADRPQKGRYREFVQCDADVIGSDSLLNEVEMVQMIDEVFSKLGIGVTIKINNRKVLMALAEHIGAKNNQDRDDFISLIDKVDKEGRDTILFKLKERFKLSGSDWDNFFTLLFTSDSSGANAIKILTLKNIFVNSEMGKKGFEEIDYIFKNFTSYVNPSQNLMNAKLEIDLSLARGLNYYTGTIIEVKISDSLSTFTSSVLGGGRYDDLTGIFGLPNVSGVGISFGVDRIYDVMEEMKLFDQLNLQSSTTQVMFVNFGKEEEKYCLKLLQQVRAAGINAEIYPDSAKMKKQMSYADDKKIPFVVLVGSEEMKTGELTMKNMQTSEQEKLKIEAIILKIKSH